MRTQKNFGRNLAWRSRYRCPGDESEVLKILADPALAHVRAFGGKHSWSGAAVCEDVSLDMAMFKYVQPYEKGGQKYVRAGAGCTLQEVLDYLHANTDQTLPTLGVIKKQTVSGAISTATHGSGRSSLSSFVAAVRVAAYDPNGTPKVFEYSGGRELEAARCAV